MGMNVGPAGGASDSGVMADINTTPLIDVMLVLLIMLIITIPVQLHAVNLNLPVSRAEAPPPAPPEVVQLDIDAAGVPHWNGEPVADADVLAERLRGAAAQAEPPELHLRPHRDAPYGVVTRVLVAARQAGVHKLGFVGNEQLL